MRRFTLYILAGILILGFALRIYNHTAWPREGATFDEYAWTWLGVNLLTKGVPISWSPHPQYEKRTHYVAPGGARFWLVEPYLEHPPVFGLIAGGYAILRGARDMYQVSFAHMRELALILGIIAIGVVYLFGSRLYGTEVGLLSSLLYAVIPSVVVGSRILQNENFFIPIFLGILLLIHRYERSGEMRYVYLAGVFAGLVTLAKVPWIAASVSAVSLLIMNKRWKEAVKFVLIVLAIFSLFIIYGMVWDAKLFFSLWGLQLARYDMAFDSIFALMTQPYLVDRYYTDGWIYAGWLAWLILLLRDSRKYRYLVFGLLGYFLVYITAIPNEPGHGWYRYPFYPFLIVSLAVFIRDWREKFLASSFLMLGIALSLLAHTWEVVFGFSYSVYRFIVLWFAAGAAPEFVPTGKMVIFASRNRLVQFALLILLSLWAVLMYNEQ